MRQYEYMNHVKTFVTHWYAFDESSYEKNICLLYTSCPPMKESNTQKELSRVPRTLSESSNTKVLEVLFDA